MINEQIARNFSLLFLDYCNETWKTTLAVANLFIVKHKSREKTSVVISCGITKLFALFDVMFVSFEIDESHVGK